MNPQWLGALGIVALFAVLQLLPELLFRPFWRMGPIAGGVLLAGVAAYGWWHPAGAGSVLPPPLWACAACVGLALAAWGVWRRVFPPPPPPTHAELLRRFAQRE
jgi:hypothetical protein